MGESAPAFRCCVQSDLSRKRGRGDQAPEIVPPCSSRLIGLGASTEAKACDPPQPVIASWALLASIVFILFYFLSSCLPFS